MPIVGFNFDKVSVEKKKNPEGEIKIKSDVVVTDLKEEKLPTGKTQAPGLRLDFKYVLEYQPDIGGIYLGGFIYYLDDPEEIKEMLKRWKKERDLPKQVMAQVINTILFKGTIKALSLAQEVNLPPHIPMPKLSPKAIPKNYIG